MAFRPRATIFQDPVCIPNVSEAFSYVRIVDTDVKYILLCIVCNTYFVVDI